MKSLSDRDKTRPAGKKTRDARVAFRSKPVILFNTSVSGMDEQNALLYACPPLFQLSRLPHILFIYFFFNSLSSVTHIARYVNFALNIKSASRELSVKIYSRIYRLFNDESS